jgi:PleD family two-component response regulator
VSNSGKKDDFYFDSLEIIENMLTLMAKKEFEIRELYERLEEYEKARPRGPLSELMNRTSENPSTVIVADTLPAMRRKLSEILAKDGDCNVIGEASNARELLEKCLRLRPQIVVADIDLPEWKDGYESLKRVKVADPHVNIIIICNDLDDVAMLKGMELGAFDLIPKPINHLRLLNNINLIRKTA